jgi:hypothetical protein
MKFSMEIFHQQKVAGYKMGKEEKTVNSKVAFWLNQIESYEQQFGNWEKRGKQIVSRYRDERKNANSGKAAKFNILWSNVQTLAPAMYASPPTPNVDRRFQDDDDLGRYSALVLERSSSFYVKDDNFDKIMKQVVLDRLLSGRGTAWVRYCPVFEEKVQITDDTYTEDTEEELKTEDVAIDYVHWRDFGHTWARTWQEVRAVWRIVYLSRAELVKRFGKEVGNKITLDTQIKSKDDATVSETGKKATIYEIWDSAKKQVIWINKSYPEVVDEKEDPLKLRKFFPCPEPLYATLTNEDLIPSPDYTQYQDQALELDFLTARISVIIKAVKVAGVYDASAEGIDRLLSEGVENKLIPVQQWAVLGAGKGLSNVVSFFPLQEIVATLSSLYDSRDRVKQDLYEITGISDIVRGATNPNETLGAQELKGKFASLRLDNNQKDVARFGRDLVVMIVEIIASHFSLDTIKQVSGIKLLTAQEKQVIQQQQASLVQAAQLQAQQQAAAGQPQEPVLPPELPEEIAELMEMPTWEEVDQLIRNDTLRSFRIDIETDSTIKVDQEAEKKSRTEFLGAVSGFLQQAVATPKELQPLVMEMLLFGVRGFKVSRELETVFETTIDKIRKASKNEQPQQSPEEIKMQQEMQLEATKMKQQMELESQKAQMVIESERLKAQAQLQSANLKAQTDLQIAQIKAQSAVDVENVKAGIAREIETTKMFNDAAIEDRRLRSSEKVARISAINVKDEDKDEIGLEPDELAETFKSISKVLEIQAAPKRVIRDSNGKITGVESVQ